MRRNGDLYDLLYRGDMDAWGDPEAVLELMGRPGEREMIIGAFRCASEGSSGRATWTREALENVKHQIAAYYNDVPRDTRLRLIFANSVKDEAVRRKVVQAIVGKFVYGGRPTFRGDPLPTGPNGMKLFLGIYDYSMDGDVKRVMSLEAETGSSENSDQMYFSTALNELKDFTKGKIRDYGDFSRMLTLFDVVLGGSVSMAVDRAFPDPIIWVPDTMVKNGRRRR